MFNDRHSSILKALCDAFVLPDESTGARNGLFSASGSSLEAAASIEKALGKLPAAQRRAFGRLLLAFDNPLVSLFWLGRFTRFSKLSAEEASALLNALSTSRIAVVRRAFDILKRVILLHAYGSETAVRTVWAERGYLTINTGRRTESLGSDSCPDSCEVLVIGSGAGGAVAAAALARKGRDVVIVEKGEEIAPSAMNGVETRAMGEMFEQGGLMTTVDGGMSLFAGSCLGGGTTVNWSASFRLPEPIRYDWFRRHGIDWMNTSEIDRAYAEVESRTNVGVDAAEDNGQNAALRTGCRELGLDVRTVPRNTEGCVGSEAKDCGRCGLGCAHDRKQGMTASFLRDVKDFGGRIVTGATVTRILTDGGRAVGAEVEIANPAGTRTHRIKAKTVVVAAGALHTPAILRRSGFVHDQIGRNLYLHPTVGVAGCYSERVNGWEGPIMSAFSDALAWMEGPWGIRIETPPIYPGLLASALPWNDARVHKEDLDRIQNTAAFIILTRDRYPGRVTLDSEGCPQARYRISEADLAMMLTGVIEAARIHIAAGAESILFPHSERKVLDARGDIDRIADLAREIFGWGWGPGYFPLFSAHQMGTCRMGGSAEHHPVDPEGRLRGVKGVYVCDGSIFPEASGVNPAVTIQAMAHVVAEQVR